MTVEPMRIWVDADACPNAIKDLLYRAADRLEIEVVMVANRHVRTPSSPFIRSVQVGQGFNVADREIEAQTRRGDLVITADVPLAAAVIDKGAHALSPRGERFTPENIGDRVAMRNLMDELRSGGMITGGPASFDRRDRQKFANQLDRILARRDQG